MTSKSPAHKSYVRDQMACRILRKQPPRTYYLLSACLAGVKCRYNGSALPVRSLLSLLRGKSLLLVCPEKLGGLPIPHPPAQIVPNNHLTSFLSPKGRGLVKGYCGGDDVWKNRARVMTESGKDFTHFFKKGARQVKDLIQPLNIKVAYLKSKSPSCGCGRVYNRHPLTKKPVLVKGDGVLTALLKKAGIRVISVD